MTKDAVMKRKAAAKVHHSLYEAKTHLSQLVERASKGEEFVITKNGVPLAKIVPMPKQSKLRFGALKGRIRFGRGFDRPLPRSVIEEFEGKWS
jgi:prevent-host-death family protein